MIQVDLTEEIEQALDRKIDKIVDAFRYELSFVGKSKYISLDEAAEELGYHKDTASRWLRKHPEIQVFNNGRSLRIHRRDFYDTLRAQ